MSARTRRASEDTVRNHCPVPGCLADKPSLAAMCAADWYRLPVSVRVQLDEAERRARLEKSPESSQTLRVMQSYAVETVTKLRGNDAAKRQRLPGVRRMARRGS